MRKHDVRKWIHAVLDMLPLFIIPIFAIYMHRHPVTNYEVETGGGAIYSRIYSSNEVSDYDDLVPYNIYSLEYFFADTSDLSETAGEFGSFEINITFLQFDSLYLDSYSFDDFVQSDYSYLDFQFNILIHSDSFTLRLISNESEVDFVLENSLGFDGAIIYFGDSDSITYFEYLNALEAGNLPQYVDFNLYTATMTESTTYNDTDIGSQFVYALYLPIEKYFNFNNVATFNNMYQWFTTNFFNGEVPLVVPIVWNIILYEFIMDVLFLIYAVFMFIIDFVECLIDKAFGKSYRGGR